MTPQRIRKILKNNTEPAEGGCLIWTGSYSYGVPKYIAAGTINVRRTVYEVLIGELQPHKIVVRTCGDKRCVAPEHLEATTRKENWAKLAKQGLIASGKLVSMRCAQSARSRSRLTMEIVRRIRTRYAETGNQRLVAREFGLRFDHVHKIVRNLAGREATPFDL